MKGNSPHTGVGCQLLWPYNLTKAAWMPGSLPSHESSRHESSHGQSPRPASPRPKRPPAKGTFLRRPLNLLAEGSASEIQGGKRQEPFRRFRQFSTAPESNWRSFTRPEDKIPIPLRFHSTHRRMTVAHSPPEHTPPTKRSPGLEVPRYRAKGAKRNPPNSPPQPSRARSHDPPQCPDLKQGGV